MIGGWVMRFAAGLRYPTLFKLVAALFVVDLLVPDLIPFADEVLLALGTLLLGALRRRRQSPDASEAVGGLAAAGRAGEVTRGRS
jgi:hypothetical protein